MKFLRVGAHPESKTAFGTVAMCWNPNHYRILRNRVVLKVSYSVKLLSNVPSGAANPKVRTTFIGGNTWSSREYPPRVPQLGWDTWL